MQHNIKSGIVTHLFIIDGLNQRSMDLIVNGTETVNQISLNLLNMYKDAKQISSFKKEKGEYNLIPYDNVINDMTREKGKDISFVVKL